MGVWAATCAKKQWRMKRGNKSETEGRHSENVVVEKEEEVKGRIGVEDACIRMRMSAQIKMSRLTSAPSVSNIAIVGYS